MSVAAANTSMVGPYVLEAHLARGGMGDVWRARRDGLDGFSLAVALKRIHPFLVTDERQRQQFIREARLGSWLRHPNAVGVLDVGIHEEVPFLVMDLVNGVDLKRLCSRALALGTPLPPALAGLCIHRVLCALEAAQQLRPAGEASGPILHRDVSPDNILVGRAGEVRVTDFGLAKQVLVRDGLTDPGTIKGKLAYMSPEQLAGEKLDVTSDLYSAGVTLFEALCGVRPHPANNPLQALEEASRPCPNPLEHAPHLPRDLALLVQRWCSPLPRDRAPSITTARQLLEEVLNHLLTGVPDSQLARFVERVIFNPPDEVTLGPRSACGKCHGELNSQMDQGGLMVDTCTDCGGVWLDGPEMIRVVGGDVQFVAEPEKHRPADGSPLDLVRGDCPRCVLPLQPQLILDDTPFHVEHCLACGGAWFDHGELERFVQVHQSAAFARIKMRPRA